MPIYPPRNNTTRKAEILKKKILKFKRVVENKSPIKKLEEEAEIVRIAQLNLLKAKLHLAKPFSSEKETNINFIKNIEKEIIKWKNLSFEDIKKHCYKTE